MFPRIDIPGLAVGILRKMERHDVIHSTIDVVKGLVGTCVSLLFYIDCGRTGVDTKEQQKTLRSINCPYPFPVGHPSNQHHLLF